jgi:hypothetical protein
MTHTTLYEYGSKPMRLAVSLVVISTRFVAAPFVLAQPPEDGPGGGRRAGATGNLVERMMAFDGDKDDKLTKSEVTDARLKRLFDQADGDKDGLVTRSELNALMARERASARGTGGGPGGFGGPGGGGRMGFGGPGGRGGFGGPPRPGQILPGMFRQQLSLSADQEKEVDALQKEVDGKLAKILTADQRQQLKEMSERGPGGPGGPGGRPGFGGPGGPGGFGRPPGGGPPPGEGPDDGPPRE